MPPRPRAKAVGAKIPIIAEVVRTLPVKLPLLHARGCGGLAIRLAKFVTRERRTRLPGIHRWTRFLGVGSTAN
jgi:hypothetical protein